MTEYAWRKPLGGEQLTWKPLTVGQEIEIEAQHQRADVAHLRKYEVVRRRILSYGDQGKVCTLDDLKAWDPLDLEAFITEIESKDALRRAALFKRGANEPSPLVELEASLLEVRSSLMVFGVAADRFLTAAKAANVPLEPGLAR